MQSVSRCLSYCLSKLWLLGVVGLIVVALLISALRAGLPYINQYNSEISQFLLKHYQLDLYASQIESRWHDGGLEVVIHDFRFNNLRQIGVNAQADSITAHLNLRRSVLSLAWRFTRLEVNSPIIKIRQLPPRDSTGADPIPYLFNLVDDIVITDATIDFDPRVYPQVGSIKIAQMSWLNSQFRHQLNLKLDNEAQPPLSVIADFYGDNSQNVSGRFYVKADKWQWLNDLTLLLPPFNDSANGEVSFELWGDYSQSSLDSMIVELGANQLTWTDNNQTKQLTITKGDLQWLPDQSGWLMEAKSLTVNALGQDWPELEIKLQQQQDVLSGQVNQLALEQLLELRSLLAPLPADTQSLLTQLSPTANLSGIKFWQHQQQWNYQLNINDYAQNQVDSLPGLSSINARIQGNEQGGKALITINNQAVDFGEYFVKPLELTYLATTVNWQFNQDGWWLFGDDFAFATADISAQLAWQLAFEHELSPVLSLYGEAQILAARNAKLYLPHIALSEGLVNYLGDGLKAGVSDDVQIIWQGALNQFPYQDHSGTFELETTLSKVDFMFDHHWLPVTDATIKLKFKNEGVFLTSNQGKVNDLAFEQLAARIPNLLNNPTLTVALVISEKIAPIKYVIDHSPLKTSIGAALNHLGVNESVRADINIHLPLDGSLPLVKGQVTLKNNSVDIKDIDVRLDDVSGDLNFVNGIISSKNLTATMFNQPVALNINTKPMANDYGVEIDLNAQWHSDKMPQQWHQYLDDYLAGTLDWFGKVTLKISGNDLHYQANFKSPMTGLALKLPQPLNKYVNQQEALTVSVVGNIEGGQFNLGLGSRAEALAQFNFSDNQLNVDNMALLVGRRFNSSDSVVPTDLSLQVDLKTLQIDQWQTFISNLDQGQQTNQFLPPLRNISIFVERLSVYGQELTNVSLSGHKQQDYWQVGLLSDQAKGSIKLYHDMATKGIVANFEYFKLNPQDGDPSRSLTKSDLLALPNLTFSCQVCQLGEYQLGEVHFNTKQVEQGLAISDLTLSAISTSLKLSGLWGWDEQGLYSNISGVLKSDNVVETLQLLNFSSSIKDSDADFAFDLNWRGDIYNPVIETLKGNVTWHLGEGHIAEVSDKGARIFSLFSLDSLRRKLVLDFRDVFVKGLFFNSFDGTFEIGQGVAVTHDANMDGIAGNLDVVGSINLTNQKLDYYLSFTPRLISNLPVVAGVVASAPQVFILAFAITKVLEPIIDVVSQVNFKLTGDIDHPEFVEVNRQQIKYKVPAEMLPPPKVEQSTDTNEDNP
ncbi:MAG: TIGR02099 family protein [Gammaproteobacteria bacterium]|nr:TIGR02099 family protein [Gammaproteobacteria bacterium]